MFTITASAALWDAALWAQAGPLRAKHSDQAPHLKAKFNTSSLSNQVTSPDYHVGIDNP
jgi:hypothetical protein